jgi:hypothetical protein
MQETLRDWYAHRDLLEGPGSVAATSLNFGRYLPSMMLERVSHARQEASSHMRLHWARLDILCADWRYRRSAHSWQPLVSSDHRR